MQELNPYELLYMCRQKDSYSQRKFLDMFVGLAYKEVQEITQQYPMLKIYYDDFLQEAKIEIIRAIDTFRSDKNAGLSTFVLLVIHRRIKNLVRSCFRERAIPPNKITSLDSLTYMDYSVDALLMDKQGLSSPEYMLRFNDAYEAVSQAVNQLSVEEKNVLYSWMNGDTYRQGVERLHYKSMRCYETRLRHIRKVIHDAIS